jgi:hypothetical protein
MSTNTSDTEKTVTDPAEIRATFAAWAADDESHPSKLSLVLAPLHDAVWWDGDDIRDVDGDPLPRAFAIAAGTGGEIAVDISVAEEGRVCFYAGGPSVALGPQHVRAFKMNSPLVHREIDGLEYALTLLPGEGAMVGCQHITRAGCRQVVNILAAHLGLEVRPKAEWRPGDLVRVARRSDDFADGGDTWIKDMDSLIGETVRIVRVWQHPGGVDYDIRRVGDTATWYLPAASLEAI